MFSFMVKDTINISNKIQIVYNLIGYVITLANLFEDVGGYLLLKLIIKRQI